MEGAISRERGGEGVVARERERCIYIPIHIESLLEVEGVVDLLSLATCLVELEP